MATILSHFYNEEYLLPWWLSHHKQYFEHGILVDYHSTDSSREIIKRICPTWEVVTSKNMMWDDLQAADDEISELETLIEGWRICLNTTEFIIGNFDTLKNKIFDIEVENQCALDPNYNTIGSTNDILIRSYLMFDIVEHQYINPDPEISLLQQRYNGVEHDMASRKNRRFSFIQKPYCVGRHIGFSFHNSTASSDFLILWYRYSPYTYSAVKRQLQFRRDKISPKTLGIKSHHYTGWCNSRYEQFPKYITEAGFVKNTRDFLTYLQNIYANKNTDIRPIIEQYTNS